MVAVASESGAKMLQFAELRKELFHPIDPTNATTDERLVQLAKVAAQAILDKLHDEKKATWKYLSISGLQFCIRDVHQMFGMNSLVVRQQMIKVRVPWVELRISYKNMDASA
jgi:hypothetical protein